MKYETIVTTQPRLSTFLNKSPLVDANLDLSRDHSQIREEFGGTIATMDTIAQFYNEDAHGEWERLDRHRTEFAVTWRALMEFLPSPPAQILDVGGGPGRYAIALTERGYQVTLIDLAEESLVRADTAAKEAGVTLAGIRQGNAIDLSAFGDSTQDAVLLFGPLYHLIDAADRTQALQEAHRVLKPDGTIFVAFLTTFSLLRVCAERFPEWLFANQTYVERVLATGIHRGEWGFTTAYHLHSNDIEPLLHENGFATLQIVSCEGIVAHLEERINALTGEGWEWWADLNYRLGKDPAIHGSATHLLYAGRKA